MTKVLVCGNSIADGTFGGATATQTWSYLLSQRLGFTVYMDALGGSPVNPLANVGEPTKGYNQQSRIDGAFALQPNPDLILFEGGVVDQYFLPLSLGLGTFRTNYDGFLVKLLAKFTNNCPILVWGPIDTPHQTDMSAWRAAANASIGASSQPNRFTIVNPTGWLDLTFAGPNFADDLHPNVAGNLIQSNKLYQSIFNTLYTIVPRGLGLSLNL